MQMKSTKELWVICSLTLLILIGGWFPTMASAAADFVINRVVMSPGSPSSQIGFSILVRVRNRGTTPGDAGQLMVWTNQPRFQSCNATGRRSVAVGTIAAGESRLVTVNGLKVESAGNKQLRVFIDSTCQTSESKEGNNQLTLAYTAVDRPELAVTDISLIPATPEPNTPFRARVTVINRGAVDAEGGQLTIWKHQPDAQACNAEGNRSLVMETLAAGQTRVITVNGLRANAGVKRLRAFVDGTCLIDEAREGNNQLAKRYRVATQLPASASVLLRQEDLVYRGAFRLPNAPYAGWATGRIGYSPERDSLFFVVNFATQEVIEISIPTPEVGATLAALRRASVLNGPREPTEGLLAQIGPIGENGGSGILIGGLLPYGDRLLGTGYEQYDADAQVTRSHWVRPIDLSVTGQAQGMFRTNQMAGRVGGYLVRIPDEWQTILGGEVLTGQFGVSVISRSSYGPAAFAMHPADVGRVNPIPLTPLLYYPQEHPAIGDWASDYDPTAGGYFNGNSRSAGAVFPAGSGSVLFVGAQGIGPFCYGDSYAGDCPDPAFPGQGTHGYPYAYHVWAYAAADFVRVRTGQLQPWEVSPYAVWTFDLPFAIEARALAGVAYDAEGGRLFISQSFGDGDSPLIHVFSIR